MKLRLFYCLHAERLMMPQIEVKWADRHLIEFAERIVQLNARFPRVLPQEINRVGARVKTQIIRNLRAQTGLKRDVIVRAIGNPIKAGSGRFSYTMTTHGGFIRLKYFNPREIRRGVVARPFGKRELFEGTFMKGGLFPNRVDVKGFDGQVMRRLTNSEKVFSKKKKRMVAKVIRVRSGVRIPDEMVQGNTRKVFDAMAGPLLKQRIEAALNRLVP